MGRPKGSTNKAKRTILEMIQEDHPGYHPVRHLADLAHDPELPKRDRLVASKEVAKYTSPQLKAVEVSSGTGGVELVWNSGINRDSKPAD